MPIEQGSGPREEAETLFAEFLQKKRTTGLSYDEFRRRHPGFAPDLDALHALYLKVKNLERASEPQTTVSAKLRERLGQELGTPIQLEDPQGSGDGVGSEMVENIVGRGDRPDTSSGKASRPEISPSGYGPYVLRGEIARGGQGAVLRVWDQDLNRNLAMKVILGKEDEKPSSHTPQADAHTLGRFLEEAQVTGQLDHPGIVPVHELGVDNEGHVYFTMKLVKGRDLAAVFDLVHEKKDGWNLTRALSVILRVCDAMSYAHAKGVIHRDLKPANIMVGRFGEVYVMDWGVARVLKREETHDLRIQETVAVRSDWRDKAREEEPKLLTMDGDIVGTPAYMSPEQASGELDQMGPHSDVYSLGAMIYHVLSGRMPYVVPGQKIHGFTIWNKLREQPPTPLSEIAPKVPQELVAICEKAMERDWHDRYADMSELAADLGAFMEHRVVHAYETGAVAELKKWVSRNKGLAVACSATIVLAIGGLGTIGYIEAKGREIAETEHANVLRLAAFQVLAELKQEADLLWPATPERIPAYEDWLGRAHALITGLESDGSRSGGGHLAQREALRARALLRTAEEVALDRQSHARYAEWDALTREWTALTRQRDGAPKDTSAFDLDPSLRFQDMRALNERAWRLVDPKRKTFGREQEGLALARLALKNARSASDVPYVLDTLAWACLANGLHEEALEVSARAINIAAAKDREEYGGYLERLEQAIAGTGDGAYAAHLDDLQSQIAALEPQVSERKNFTFEDDEDRWWHDQLSKLIGEIDVFADPETGLVEGLSKAGWGVQRRLDFAREVEALTVTGAEAARRWQEAVASIADQEECPAYRGLRIDPQLGLLPIGRNPDTGLWEFGHVQSGELPRPGAEGTLEISGETCIVLILIPPTRFFMGSQALDDGRGNYDAAGESDERPVHEVPLEAFFISKYEMTQGQWQRCIGANPASYHPGFNINAQPKGFELANPVEMVTLENCRRILGRLGLQIPTEAQWECAARGGEDTPWCFGLERQCLDGAANLADEYMLRSGGPRDWDYEEWDDGYWFHAPVGSFAPNAFGLHDVHGNLWELCRDPYGSYSEPVEPATGYRITNSKEGVVRGGSFESSALDSRTASRSFVLPGETQPSVGVRPARMLTVH